MFGKEVISIDIGSNNIKVVVGKQQKKEFIISDAFLIKTPEDAYDDGKLTDIGLIAEYLGGQIRERKIRCKNAVFTLNSSAIITREIVLPAKKSSQLENMIHFEISQFLPVDLSQYIIEYKFMEEFVEDGVNKSKILVVAVPKVIIDGYYDLALLLKLNPHSMDINANAIAKLLKYPSVLNEKPFSGNEACVAVDIGAHSINVSIVLDGQIGISRMITQGSHELDKCIMIQIHGDNEEAERWKKEKLEMETNFDLSPEAESLRSEIGFIVDNWTRDIERIVKFYESRNNEMLVAHLYLYGGGADLKGLLERISKVLNLPVSKIEMLNHVKLTGKAKEISMKPYLNAIGAITSNR